MNRLDKKVSIMTKFSIYGVSITDENLNFQGINKESWLPYYYLYINLGLIIITIILSVLLVKN